MKRRYNRTSSRRLYTSLVNKATLCKVSLVVSLFWNHSDAGWVDPDTPQQFQTATAFTQGDDREYELVFSDEFEKEGRKFGDGEDPKWTAINKNDYTNDALHYYSNKNVQTTNGVLNITSELKDNAYKAFNEKTKKYYADAKHVQSGMVQGWNKFCMVGGIVEFSAKLPGKATTGGLWPALWMLGNLARATYVGSSDYMWPFSYSKCDASTHNSQEINACHQASHYGMAPGVGRGAPEIDILEAMGGEPGKLPNTHIERPYFSASLQIAPGVKKGRPVLGSLPNKGHWYEGLEYGNVTNSDLNPFFYGVTLVHEPKTYTYQSDALSSNMHITESHYEHQHLYRVEWEPPNKDGSGGYIKWFSDGELVYGIHGSSLKITGTEIPSEPMYLLMNTAIASSWGFPMPCPEGCDCECFECGNPDCDCGFPDGFCENFPSFYEIDYVRVYQAVNETKHVLGCSTPDRPTDLFIKAHKKRYMSEGDKAPLQPVKNGGAVCHSDEDCGGSKSGKCTSKKCICNEGFTGPSCYAYAGFDDNYFGINDASVDVVKMIFPTGLLVAFMVLLVGFIVALVYSTKYQKVENSQQKPIAVPDGTYDIPSQGFPTVNTSYQKPSSAFSPPRVVKYALIDRRLIDE